ncbi:dihydrofolate reductase family protein [Mucilaginibacter sp.]|uniref:dihydrofolate reductase family protein n=1 Tax=Mucilaginibacter sp. TaxID=1882438 RepID=UPI0035BC26B7
MRRLVVSMNVTLNGFMAGPDGELDWHTPFWNDEMSHVAAFQLGNADTLVLGRNTYQGMASYWGAHQSSFLPRENADYAQMMNSCEKVVFSRSLMRIGAWNNTRLAARHLKPEINQLKQKQGKDILVYGSGKLVAGLIRHNLVDEYRLWIYPIALKKGRPLFKNLRDRLGLRATNTMVFENGVVLLSFEKAAGENL